MTSFIKLSDNFKVDWDIDNIVSNISDDVITPIVLSENNILPYTDPTEISHWQIYSDYNISFSRNFYKNFTLECIEVANKLKELQRSLTGDSELFKSFIEHEIDPRRVSIIRTQGGNNVGVHCDITRGICINIGLKNSNTFRTRIGNDCDIINFYDKPTETYIMNDGDVYLISIQNAHCVESLTMTSEPRYIITYNLK